jgi:putative ABC transport system substrate-binding protein
MKRRQVIGGIGGGLVLPALAQAQSAKQTVGLLAGTKMDDWALPAIRKGLAEAGYDNPDIVHLSADGQFDRLPALADELVKRRVSVILALGSARTAKAATATIPVVFAYGGDPVADGLVATLNRPGGNLTGVTFIGTALTAKRLELLAQLSDRIVDIALLVNPNGTLAEGPIKEAQAAAPALKLRVQVINCGGASELDAAFTSIKKSNLDALLVGTDPLLGFALRDQIVAKAIQERLPSMWSARPDVEPSGLMSGGLMSYGADLRDTYRQAGLYVGRILKGAKPTDLPVQQASKFELVINLGTAKAIGIEIPQTLKLQADDLIE